MLSSVEESQSCVWAEPCEASVTGARRILIIDDDLPQAEALGYCLRRQGFEVSLATNCAAGLQVARTQAPHLIILDLCLPDGDGLDVCAELSDARETAGVPVIIVSGADRTGVVRQARTAGCQFFVHKPYDPNALLVLVEQALTDAQAW